MWVGIDSERDPSPEGTALGWLGIVEIRCRIGKEITSDRSRKVIAY